MPAVPHASAAFDLDGTLLGHWQLPDGSHRIELRPEASAWIEDAKRTCGRVILWTFANRNWYEKAARKFPVLRDFHEVWTRDELRPHITTGGGGYEPVKDVRELGVDLLVDNEPAHLRWAKRHGLEHHYLIVPTFGEG